MKNKIGIVIGFIIGMVGFLMMFKVIFLDNIPPEDELAPGIVVFIAILSGFAFAYIGSRLQGYLSRNRA